MPTEGSNLPPTAFYTCANCQRTIGALEQPYQWGEHIVCPTCLPLLQQPQQHATPQIQSRSRAKSQRPKFSKPPLTMHVMFWIGVALWFGPSLALVAMDANGQDLSGMNTDGIHQIAWLGAILCIGSLVIWAIIVAAKSD